MKYVVGIFMLLGCGLAGAVSPFNHGSRCLEHAYIGGQVTCVESYICRPAMGGEIATVECVCELDSGQMMEGFNSTGESLSAQLAEAEARAICNFVLDERLKQLAKSKKKKFFHWTKNITCSEPSYCFYCNPEQDLDCSAEDTDGSGGE